MVVLVMGSVPGSLRGECTRYLIEIKAGVFVGTLSTRVRNHLWEMVTKKSEAGSAILLYDYPNEQGFIMQMHGDPQRCVIDMDGLQLVKIQ